MHRRGKKYQAAVICRLFFSGPFSCQEYVCCTIVECHQFVSVGVTLTLKTIIQISFYLVSLGSRIFSLFLTTDPRWGAFE